MRVYTVCGLTANEAVSVCSTSFRCRDDNAAYLAVRRLRLADEDVLEVWQEDRLVWRFEAPRKVYAALGQWLAEERDPAGNVANVPIRSPAGVRFLKNVQQRRSDHVAPGPVPPAKAPAAAGAASNFAETIAATHAAIERSRALLRRLREQRRSASELFS